MAVLVEFDAGQERCLVLGAATGFVGMLADKHGVVGDHNASEQEAELALVHGLEQLAVDQLGRGIADAQMELERHRSSVACRSTNTLKDMPC